MKYPTPSDASRPSLADNPSNPSDSNLLILYQDTADRYADRAIHLAGCVADLELSGDRLADLLRQAIEPGGHPCPSLVRHALAVWTRARQASTSD